MSAATKIPVSGAVLRWAREQRGLTVEAAAKRLVVKPEKLEAFEDGSAQPSLPQVRKMVDVYRRPLIVLLLDAVPTAFTAMADYRSLGAGAEHNFSPELRDEIRRAAGQRDIYIELQQELGHAFEPSALPADSGNAVRLASDLRQLLGVTHHLQRRWSQPETAYAEWRTRVEALGILVLETSRVEVSEMRGFSLSETAPYVIVVNGQDAPRGKVFTLLHELAHLCGRTSGVCDLHDRSIGSADVEVYCNAVAGEALLPGIELSAHPVVATHAVGSGWTDAELDAVVAEAGGASKEAVLRRLLQLGMATREEYEAKRAQYLEDWAEFRKLRREKRKGKGGGPPPHRVQLRDRGRPFIRTVFDAYGEGVIGLSEVADLTGVRVKHLATMEREAQP